MDKQRDISNGELADTMKNGEGTGVEGERGLFSQLWVEYSVGDRWISVLSQELEGSFAK